MARRKTLSVPLLKHKQEAEKESIRNDKRLENLKAFPT